MAASSKLSDLKVGLFVLIGLILVGLVVFLIGDERRLWGSHVQFTSTFDDVQGLKGGAPVRMGGVRIGQVTEVNYGNTKDPQVHVRLQVVADAAGRIRSDSKAKIVPKGMLGDRMVDIQQGTKGDVLAPGKEIPSVEPDDLLARIDQLSGKAESTMDGIGAVAEPLADQQLHLDIRESARSINVLLKQLTEGDGYPHRFLTDKAEADRISRVIDNLDKTSIELAVTMREVRLAVQQLRGGPGFAHDVLFGDGPQKELAQVGGAAEELSTTLRAIREGDGFAHDVLFGGDDETKDALANLTQMSADLRDIVADVKKGKGTIGALLVDPSIYEDVKRVLGNVERNSVLRALVRYSINRDQKKPKVEVGTKTPR